MRNEEITTALNEAYPIRFERVKLLREAGNATYAAYSADNKYFLKVVDRAFDDTFATSVEVNLYLQDNGFCVPKIIRTAQGKPFATGTANNLILYEYLEMSEINMDKDAEEVGATVGRLHTLMSCYGGRLAVHGKEFYLDRYIEILKKKGCSKLDEYIGYGERLWDRIKTLPQGYSHDDLYVGNIARGADGKLYVLDLDTSCIGFPMYDLALICNQTDYFYYKDEGYPHTASVYERLLPQYLKERSLTPAEISSLYDMLALYHFALQATIVEIHGSDCVNEEFFDKQLDWLKRWQAQTD